MIEMQTRFDVNKLELEKSKLANKNKQIALTGTLSYYWQQSDGASISERW